MTGWGLVALQATPVAPPPIEPGLGAVRAIVALVVVMVALVGFLWLLKRGTFAAFGGRGSQGLAVESALSLGERRSLVIVSVEGRRLLLGLSSAQVTLITELAQRPPAFGHALDGALASQEAARR
jgi:flagellar protein FliO/FliZ